MKRTLATKRSPIGIAAFTLIEMMAVMVIIALLAGIVIGTAGYIQRKAATARAEAEIHAMEMALESYKNDNGGYPIATVIAAVYTALAGGPKIYMSFKADQLSISGSTTNIIDPFGTAYNYTCNASAGGNYNRATFDLWSNGPDRGNNSGTGDDIANFKR